MARVNDIVNKCKSLSASQLGKLGEDCYWDLAYYLNGRIGREKTTAAIIDTLLVCTVLDGYFSRGEWEFMQNVFHISDCNYEYYCEQFDDVRRQEVQLELDVKGFCRVLPAKERISFVTLCIAMMCADGHFTYEDLDFLEDCLLD